jgi:ubiquitin C
MTGTQKVRQLEMSENTWAPPDGQEITIRLHTLTGKWETLTILASGTVDYLKQEIWDKTDYVGAMSLVFVGKRLQDGHTLQEYGITDQSAIHMILELRGTKRSENF